VTLIALKQLSKSPRDRQGRVRKALGRWFSGESLEALEIDPQGREVINRSDL
jgi:hypothetical protein